MHPLPSKTNPRRNFVMSIDSNASDEPGQQGSEFAHGDDGKQAGAASQRRHLFRPEATMVRSELFAGAAVPFPSFTGERVYMREIALGAALPADLARWQSTVDAMTRGILATGPAFLMIDQTEVSAGQTHRRPGLHVDGYWHPVMSRHGNQPAPGGGHNPAPAPRPGHVFAHSGHCPSGAREALIIASDVEGCEAYEGEWDGVAGAGGDCSAVRVARLRRQRMCAGVAWIGETGALLHSAIPLSARNLRTVVRINVQGWA